MTKKIFPHFDEEDIEHWHNYKITVKPLQRIHSSNHVGTSTKKVYTSKTLSRDKAFHAPTSSASKATKQLKNIHIQGKLDLHGLSEEAAHARLNQFISESQNKGLRCVLVITGKGGGLSKSWWQEPGILKKNVPRWLSEEPLKSKVTTYSIAKPQDGGAGALYIFLKR